MSKIAIFWDPKGIELDSLGTKKYLRATDGDTPYVSIPIRMLSIDTPEVHYPGNQKPSKQDEKLAQLAEWIQAGKSPVNSGLAQYIHPKLSSGTAGSLQEEQGLQASDHFKKLVDEKLVKPNGKKRDIFLRAADQHFDQYGRLLAYVAPSYNANELAIMSRKQRATFNLLMVDSGWAAPFPIYPSIPSYPDLVLLQEIAKDAQDNKRGAWQEPLMLTGYEFRMCVKLYEVTKKLVDGKKVSSNERYGWVTRYCVDMTTRKIFYPQNYHKVPSYNRIFIWPDDLSEAVGKMNLVPGE
ncbi:thermonuclease family protein [bacterium]|nr:thermonuclease family protein [bacterium]